MTEWKFFKLAKKNSRFVPCSNKKNGCQETFEKLKILDDVIAKHEKECIYRLVPCLNNGNGCKEKVIFSNLIPHFEDVHARYTGVPLQHRVSLRIVPNKKKMLSHFLQNAMIWMHSFNWERKIDHLKHLATHYRHYVLRGDYCKFTNWYDRGKRLKVFQ